MTFPLPPPEAQNLAYELDVARRVSEPARQQLHQFTQQAAAAYVMLAGGLDRPVPPESQPLLRDTVLRLLSTLTFGLSELLRALIGQGSPELTQAINQMDERANGQIGNAAHFATTAPLRNWEDLTAVTAKAGRAVNTIDQTARWAANRRLAEDVRAQADLFDAQVVWVAERDACLHCLAYAGEVAGRGQRFREGLTFYIGPEGEPKPLHTGPLWSPPLHPNCRCRLQVWMGYDEVSFGPDAAGLVGLPQVLKREAQRSVLRGFSGSDSEPARLRAVDLLLQRGAVMLGRSVQDRARRDVEAGEFVSAQRVRRP